MPSLRIATALLAAVIIGGLFVGASAVNSDIARAVAMYWATTAALAAVAYCCPRWPR